MDFNAILSKSDFLPLHYKLICRLHFKIHCSLLSIQWRRWTKLTIYSVDEPNHSKTEHSICKVLVKIQFRNSDTTLKLYSNLAVLQKFNSHIAVLLDILVDPADESGDLGISIWVAWSTSTNHEISDANNFVVPNGRASGITVAYAYPINIRLD